jgi:hypothetical protein
MNVVAALPIHMSSSLNDRGLTADVVGTYMARTSVRLRRGETAFVAACNASVCSWMTADRTVLIVLVTRLRVLGLVSNKSRVWAIVVSKKDEALLATAD